MKSYWKPSAVAVFRFNFYAAQILAVYYIVSI